MHVLLIKSNHKNLNRREESVSEKSLSPLSYGLSLLCSKKPIFVFFSLVFFIIFIDLQNTQKIKNLENLMINLIVVVVLLLSLPTQQFCSFV